LMEIFAIFLLNIINKINESNNYKFTHIMVSTRHASSPSHPSSVILEFLEKT
jgi:hypothetical protein